VLGTFAKNNNTNIGAMFPFDALKKKKKCLHNQVFHVGDIMHP
jgi:hypothetical protein